MKQYIYKFVALLLVFVMILFIENYIDNQKNKYIEYIEVLVANRRIEEGIKISKDLFKSVRVIKTDQSEKMAKSSEAFIGQYAKIAIEADQYIYSNAFNNTGDLTFDAKERLLTVQLSIEESNGWHFKKGQIVDLIAVNESDSSKFIMKDVKIHKLFDEQLRAIENPFFSEHLPLFVSVIVDEAQLSRYIISKNKTQIYVSVK